MLTLEVIKGMSCFRFFLLKKESYLIIRLLYCVGVILIIDLKVRLK